MSLHLIHAVLCLWNHCACWIASGMILASKVQARTQNFPRNAMAPSKGDSGQVQVELTRIRIQPLRKKPDPDWSFNNNNNWYISWKEKTMHGYTGRSDFIKMESIDISMIYHLWFRFRFRPFFWIPNPDPTYLKTGSGSDQTPYVTESATLISGGPGHLALNSWSIYYMVTREKNTQSCNCPRSNQMP